MKKILLFLIAIQFCAFNYSCKRERVIQVEDKDKDGIPDDTDNCIDIANKNQADKDKDGKGDVCDDVNDLDLDEDGIPNEQDNCPNTSNPDQADKDGDGVGDSCDDTDNNDLDNDGIKNIDDNCPNIANPDQKDKDKDGKGDACDDKDNRIQFCEDGKAGAYSCSGYDLLAQIDLTKLESAKNGNDCWGWTDKASGREFAIMGTNKNTTFIEVTDPVVPKILGFLPTASVASLWRDIKVYENHAYIVSEAANHGLQVFDLTKLLTIDSSAPQTFTPDATYKEFSKAHNIAINEKKAIAYIVGFNGRGVGTQMVDISNPKSPKLLGTYTEGGYCHDAQIVTYNGPDPDYQGKEIFLGSNESKLVIADLTDPENPKTISETGYSNSKYTHQGWLTEDSKYFLVGDELDEMRLGNKTKTIVFDVSDLDKPAFHSNYLGPTPAIDHNGYVKGNTFYLSNYAAGVRFIDVSDIDNMKEIGYFDTYPEDDKAAFHGVWNVYPYFESGTILVSDYERGLFLLRKK